MANTEGTPVLSLSLLTKEELSQAYVPFIRGVGLLLKNTDFTLELNECYSLKLQLLDEPYPYLLTGEVVWLDESTINGDRVGVQLTGDNVDCVRKKILSYLSPL